MKKIGHPLIIILLLCQIAICVYLLKPCGFACIKPYLILGIPLPFWGFLAYLGLFLLLVYKKEIYKPISIFVYGAHLFLLVKLTYLGLSCVFCLISGIISLGLLGLTYFMMRPSYVFFAGILGFMVMGFTQIKVHNVDNKEVLVFLDPTCLPCKEFYLTELPTLKKRYKNIRIVMYPDTNSPKSVRLSLEVIKKGEGVLDKIYKGGDVQIRGEYPTWVKEQLKENIHLAQSLGIYFTPAVVKRDK
jgi:hypothetical protein